MGEPLKTIDKYYTDMKYEGNEDEELVKEALTKISTIAEEIKFSDVNDFSERFLKTASVIEENLYVFKIACDHRDIIHSIIEYLNYFGMKFMLGSKCDEEYEKDDIVLSVLFTILINVQFTCDRYRYYEIKSFFTNAIIEKSALRKSIQYKHLRQVYCGHCEIILLADSDLYAFVTLLGAIIDLAVRIKIWIQEPIKEKFLWIMNNYFGYKYDDFWNICIFRTREELFTARTTDKINIVSIWTEDIVFAINLAMSLNGDVLFINSYMDFYGGIVLLPFTKIFGKTLHKCESNFDDSIKKLSVQTSVPVYNLFYDGMWQRPVKDTYWIHDDSQWANATSNDVNKCINSAEKGFEIWSNKSIACKMQILSKFASTLECSGKSVLADIISKWIKCSCIYEKSLSLVSQSKGLEVIKIRNPRGVIILKEDDEAVLFRRLMQILTVGNTVIVICDANSCSLVPYCNMFSVSEIPPGVINLLSSENVKQLELALCGMDYASYAKQFFSDFDDIEKTYISLTKPKQIIVPLK